MQSTESRATARPWLDYRAVWRWHFYAGLLSLPFVIVLSISGAIYLFKPQIEAWIERPYDRLTLDGPSATVADQVRAAVAAFPGAVPTGYELPRSADAAARILVQHRGESLRVYVHPASLQVLHAIPDRDRFMRWIFRLHGELLLGDRGSHLVELVASWTVVLVLTGLYLWWPRQSRGWGGILYPRLNHGSKVVWRDLHAVVGVWISLLTLFLLATGLPWAKFWGGYFKNVRQWTGTAVAKQDWSTGDSEDHGRPSSSTGARGVTEAGEHAGHGGGAAPAKSAASGAAPTGRVAKAKSGASRWRRGRTAVMPKDLDAFDRVAATIRPLALAHPVIITPPATNDSEEWTAASEAANRPLRTSLVVNGGTGAIVSRENFRDRHWVDQAVGIGIAAHEGQLFGWPNQILGLVTAVGLVLLSVSGAVMWWRRRDVGVLGAPPVYRGRVFSWTLLVLIGLLAIYLPLFGASLIVVLIVEKLLLVRIPPVRRWLGLAGGDHATT